MKATPVCVRQRKEGIVSLFYLRLHNNTVLLVTPDPVIRSIEVG